jgi:hypothetical protein
VQYKSNTGALSFTVIYLKKRSLISTSQICFCCDVIQYVRKRVLRITSWITDSTFRVQLKYATTPVGKQKKFPLEAQGAAPTEMSDRYAKQHVGVAKWRLCQVFMHCDLL